MKRNIDKLIEISKYLNDNDTASLLSRMNSTLSSKNYILTVMGQFSAGKSTLINELLGKDILPVNKSETTAVVTYLKYSDEEYAELVYNDGKTEKCTVEESLNFEQNKENHDKLCSLDAINIYIPCDILKNGLIIADTPGVNTVLKEHTEKTVKLFEASSRIVYVLSGAMSSFDANFLTTIKSKGLKSIIVRTYMDTIYSDEENPDEIISSETKNIRKYTDEPAFFTSAKKESRFYENIGELRNYISKNIAEQAEKQLEEAINERTEYIAKTLEPKLKNREKAVAAVVSDNENEYARQREELERKAKKLRDTLEKSKTKLKTKFDDAVNDADDDLKTLADNETKKISSNIKSMNFSDSLTYHSDIEDMLKNSCTSMRTSYIAGFDRILKENKEEVMNEVNLGDDDFYLNVELPDSVDEAGEAADEIKEKIESLIALKDEINEEMEESRNRVIISDEEKKKAADELEQYTQALNALEGELDEYGDYVEQYRIQEGTHTHEKNMRFAGRVLDFASILIPGEAWVKIGGTVLKGAKAIKGVDTVADVARGLHMLKKNAMKEKYNLPMLTAESSTTDYAALQQVIDSQEEKVGLLDLLSIEFYFSKIGKKFDTPDTIVVDEEYKAQYEMGRKNITDRIAKEAREAADKRIDIGKITDKIEQEKIYQAELEKRKKKADKEIDTLDAELEKERVKQYNSVCASHYISAISDYISGYASDIKKKILPVISEKFENYFETYGLEAEGEINNQQRALDELKEKYSGRDSDEIKNELDKCRSYLEILR